MYTLFGGIYNDKNVLVTGHTGFKGSWLAFWLIQMGAKVVGYALEPNTTPNHFSLLNFECISIIGDIRNKNEIEEVFDKYKPDIVFHLAAQPLVRYSYKEPLETFETNVIGTVNVFEACKKTSSVRAIVNITSDKCYENKEWVWGYRENDPMGGYDPYSASKGCAELITNCYRSSYFNIEKYDIEHNILLASCRAGNVIGGGDWSEDRLFPDIVKAAFSGNKVYIRNPFAIRPWQHVLEPLSGYLAVGQKLLEGKKEFAEGWNFGPNDESNICVEEIVKYSKKIWDKIDYEIKMEPNQPHEANLLKLDCSKAHIKLKWKSVWDKETTFKKAINWYKSFYESNIINTETDLKDYVNSAKNKHLSWCK